MTENKYIVGNTYIDKSSKKHPDDQLLRWLDNDNVSIANLGGIRKKSYTKIEKKDVHNLPSSLFLFTEKTNNSSLENPWKDQFDLITGDINYWGDAKYDKTKRKTKILDWNGNKVLNLIFKSIKNFRDLIPPIFHFTKDKVGEVTFNGIFTISKLNKEKFIHKGHEIDNFIVNLKKMDVDEIYLSWINYRSGVSSINQINQSNEMDKIPEKWIQYINGDQN